MSFDEITADLLEAEAARIRTINAAIRLGMSLGDSDEDNRLEDETGQTAQAGVASGLAPERNDYGRHTQLPVVSNKQARSAERYNAPSVALPELRPGV